MRGGAAAIAAAGLLGACAPGQADQPDGPLRILSLDGCADQYVLALAPDADLALSPRADDPDSRHRREAAGRRRVRPTLEAAVGFRPDVAVRQWGGDARLVAALRRRGVTVVELGPVEDFDGIRSETLRLAKALGRETRGLRLVDEMDDRLAGVGGQGGRPVLYMTAAGWTAGKDTLVDEVLTTAGLTNLERNSGYRPLSLERLALAPPEGFVLAFFDRAGSDRRGVGRHPVVQDAVRAAGFDLLPSALIACGGPHTVEAVERLAR